MPRSVKAEIEKRCKEYRDQMASSIERLAGERDQFHRERDEARADLALRQTGALPPLEHLLRENERLRALLRECHPLALWHRSSGYEGDTLGPSSDLPERIAAALEGRDA